MLTFPRATRARRAVPLAVMAAGLLASCAATSTNAGGAVLGGAATPSSGASGASSSSASPGVASGHADLAACQPIALLVAIDTKAAEGAAGSIYYPVNFTNTSGLACGMYGYPGVSLVTAGDKAGRQVGAPALRNPAFGDVPVRLAAGGVAHAWLQVANAGNYPASVCKPVTTNWLRIYGPGQTVALYVKHAFNACASASARLLTVMPVRAGQGVRGKTP